MKTGNKTLVFRYVLNKLIGFNYNDGISSKEYLYLRNIQGDIVGIFDDNGTFCGGYAYDAYGNHVITKDVESIAELNPFRYRGYFYDEETKLYYLNARYYDPETGRFISPDTLSILDETRGQINGLNLYTYCGNNPVMRIDPSGHKWWEFWKWDWIKIGAFIGSTLVVTLGIGLILLGGPVSMMGVGLIATGIGSLINGYINKSDKGTFLGGWVGGMISGLLSLIPHVGTILGVFTGSAITDWIDNRDFGSINWGKAGISAAISWILCAFPAAIGQGVAVMGKDTALCLITAYDSLLLSIISSVINVFWRGRDEKEKSKKRLRV